ncbi:AAA family ATPase [Ruminococcus sp.]|uniref:ATP-dependent nuclease n=1 Tax=Ruminococcus sp. TaxID=41978 RepID=UPI0025D04B4A|nr:AAA family ATPase [Ruminococcus sp.]
MKLLRYKVTNFRSVEDSGWIECDDVTTLVGINESGKSNLLLALWKLHPVNNGEIDILHDMPVSKLSVMRNNTADEIFIEAVFSVDMETIESVYDETGYKIDEETEITLKRFYDGHYSFQYSIQPILDNNNEDIEDEVSDDSVAPKTMQDLNDVILEEIPKFVYYSNYGNLSSKIYLPNVVKWLNGGTVQGIDVNEEQVRTLRVLFDFVHLDPEEILELGKDPKDVAAARNGNRNNVQPTAQEIKKAEDDKEQRSLLLQSASGDLTTKFKEWWKQGEYKFRFEADGDYFRIWVSDSKRPSEVALELRSTGLQWFISFYLIFLVESESQHKNAILLLDEAGLTLHPLAQKDLTKFFNGLAEKNQIINTTHSPFIIDTSNIDRCRVVYSDENGFTVVSSDLRIGSAEVSQQSIYAVHAAMGLSVSDILLQGCQPVIVEGPSDQHYLNAIKTFLIKTQKISPSKEIIFVPSGGVRGISGVVSILGGKNNDLPYVIVDSDKSGKDYVNKLYSDLYKDEHGKVIEIQTITEMENSEVEDIIPYSLLEKGIRHFFHFLEDEDFEDEYDDAKPIVNQIEKFASDNNVDLEKGWKVELAKAAKKALLKAKEEKISNEYIEKWVKLFELIK